MDLLNKVDPTVRRETVFIAGCVLAGSAVMEMVFLVLGSWNWTVLAGNLLGGVLAVGNFFLMGLTIQKSLGMSAEDAATRMKLSQKLRMLLMVVVCAVAAALPCFDLVATLVPLLFPRIAVTIRGLTNKNTD